MPNTDIAIMRISEEDYPRFAKLFGPNVPPDYAAFERNVTPETAKLNATGVPWRRVTVDPDAMLRWCMDVCGRIDSKARTRYVALVALEAELP